MEARQIDPGLRHQGGKPSDEVQRVERLLEHPRVLGIQDTSELDYTGKTDIQGTGPLNYESRRGLYLHPTLAVTPDRLCLAWRVLFLTMLGRECPEIPCDVVFDEAEWQAVYLVTQRQPPPDTPPSLDRMVRMIVRLGGFLDRK